MAAGSGGGGGIPNTAWVFDFSDTGNTTIVSSRFKSITDNQQSFALSTLTGNGPDVITQNGLNAARFLHASNPSALSGTDADVELVPFNGLFRGQTYFVGKLATYTSQASDAYLFGGGSTSASTPVNAINTANTSGYPFKRFFRPSGTGNRQYWAADDSWHVYRWVYLATASGDATTGVKFYIDGVDQGAGSFDIGSALTPQGSWVTGNCNVFAIGALRRTSVGLYATFDVGEIVHWRGDPVVDVTADLADKWGISI